MISDRVPDWLFCVISITLAAVYNWRTVLRQVWPHVVTLGLFLGFVAWNGGVVLGESLRAIMVTGIASD